MNVALWLHDNGVGVFPIQPKSKEPACRWATYEPVRARIGEFTNYGVRLGVAPHALGVLDPDSLSLVSLVKSGAFEVPDTPFIVHTARGLHLYYRLPVSEQPVPKFVRRQGVSIEFRNKGQYVVGPGSVHPTGVIYQAEEWSWQWDDIPFWPADFAWDDGTVRSQLSGTGDFIMPEAVYEPERHETLNSYIASLVTKTDLSSLDRSSLWAIVEDQARMFCDNICVPPLKWDATLAGFVARSFRGAFKLRERPRTEHVAPFEGISL